jgi:hypothetical protein
MANLFPAVIALCIKQPVFKIEVFNALQMQFGLSEPFSQQPSKTQPQIENEDVIRSPPYDLSITRTNKRRALSTQEVEFSG